MSPGLRLVHGRRINDTWRLRSSFQMEQLPADQILCCQKGFDSFEGVTAFVALSASLIYSQEAE